MTERFYTWLQRQRDRQDPIGDLARDTRGSDAIPIPDGDTWLQHWLGEPVSDHDQRLITRWRLAWAEWRKCASQRAIADMTGSSHATIGADLGTVNRNRSGENSPKETEKQAEDGEDSPPDTQPWTTDET